jgi:hypothetical protein
MRRLSVIPAALAALGAVLAAGCSTSGYDRTATSSIAPRTTERPTKERYSSMVTQDRTGYIVRRVQP